jgi:hypothetical protein
MTFGHALVRQAAHAVGGVGVRRDHVDLERAACGAGGAPVLAQAGEQPRQSGQVPAAVQPAVAQPGGPAQGRVGVAADEHWDRRAGHRGDLDRRQVEDLPVVLEVAPGRQPAQDGDLLVHALPAGVPVHAEHLVVFPPRAGPDAQDQAVAGQDGRRGGLLGHQHRVADRELEHERDEPDPLGHRAEGGNERERLEEGLVLEELAAAVGIERVPAVGAARIADAVGHHHRGEPSLLGGARQRGVERRIGHRLGVAESHGKN